MALDIVYHLPPDQKAFAALTGLLLRSEQKGSAPSKIILTGGRKGLRNTIFQVEVGTSTPKLELKANDQKPPLPSIALRAPSREDAITFTELAMRLSGHARQVDHTGIGFSTTQTAKEEWLNNVQYICKRVELHEYPAQIDGYKPGPMRWLYALPDAYNWEENPKLQPKFEMNYDAGTEQPFIQIDLETAFTREELAALFPSTVRVLPSPRNNFLRVWVSDFNANFRIDLRFDTQYSKNDWNTGRFLKKHGKLIRSSLDLRLEG